MACAITSATRTSTTLLPTSDLIALVTGGEGLHNNHHGYPRSPKFSFRASEIDPAWPIIRLLIALNSGEAVPKRSRDRRLDLVLCCFYGVVVTRRPRFLRGLRDGCSAPPSPACA